MVLPIIDKRPFMLNSMKSAGFDDTGLLRSVLGDAGYAPRR